MMTYVLVCEPNIDNIYKVKIGRTESWANRLRMYKLHNQSIKDYIVFNGDYEFDLLLFYREYRISDMATDSETEWIALDYNPIVEIFSELNLTSFYESCFNIDPSDNSLRNLVNKYRQSLEIQSE
jgi:hypothetical protein